MAIIQTTIQGLRTANRLSINPGDVYYVTDKGQEGYWRSDDGSGNREESSSFVDNLGVTLNTGWSVTNQPPTAFPQAVLRRVYDGYVNVKWFGAKGDGVTDDTDSIQNALKFLSHQNSANNQWLSGGGGTLFMPAGRYYITTTIKIGQHTRILGVSKGGDFYQARTGTVGPGLNQIDSEGNYQTGTVIKCVLGNRNSWAFDADTGSLDSTSPTPIAIPYDGFITGASVDNGLVTMRYGIVIEGIIFDCMPEGADASRVFGGIRLISASNSIVRNCAILGAKIGVLLSGSWNCHIENVYSNTKWYGIVIRECNSVTLTSTYSVGIRGAQTVDSIPAFVYGDYDGLTESDVKKWTVGIYVCGGQNITLVGCAVEKFKCGVFACWVSLNADSLYIEGETTDGNPSNIRYGYGIMSTGPVVGNIDLVHLNNLLYGFYVGVGPQLNVNGVTPSVSMEQLYVPNSIPGFLGTRRISFNNVRKLTAGVPILDKNNRTFQEDIFFTDEIGDTVYVDSTDPNNTKNIGFSSLDPVYSIDDAIRRCYYSGRKVKRILIKKGTTAIKDAGERYLEAFDVFISTYGESTQPTRIQFQGTGALGQMSIKGMVRIHIKGVDLVCSTAQPTDYSMNASIFRINFGHLELKLESMHVDLGNGYSLVAGDYSANNLQKSFLTTRWVNVTFDGTGEARLSPYQWGAKNLIVDCLQYGAVVNAPIRTKTNKGWDDTEIINNNII